MRARRCSKPPALRYEGTPPRSKRLGVGTKLATASSFCLARLAFLDSRAARDASREYTSYLWLVLP